MVAEASSQPQRLHACAAIATLLQLMVQRFNLYIDDSGTRHPDRHLRLEGTDPDWFALGGVLVDEQHEASCRQAHTEFCEKWSLTYPLHSEEIRHSKRNFRWMKDSRVRSDEFMSELGRMLLSLPVYGIACVIDRRGYHRRYHERYGAKKWSLCKSAFDIVVERACKFARARGCKLDVFVERSDAKTDARITKYHEDLKRVGHPFDPQTSSRYNPLAQSELADTLYDLKLKTKSSPMMQIADLYLYPICKGRYMSYRPHFDLVSAKKLLDDHVSDPVTLGVKYYCFEQVSADTSQKKLEPSDKPSAPGQPSKEDLVG